MEVTRLLWSKAGCALPWLTMALVVAVAATINSIIDLGSLSFHMTGVFPSDPTAAVSADLHSVTKHLLARVAWGLSSIAFSIVTVAAIATTLYVLCTCFHELSGRERVAGGAVILACAAPIIAIVLFGADSVPSEPAVTTDFRRATLHMTTATRAVVVDSLFDKLSYAIFLLLTSAAAATLLWPTAAKTPAAMLRRRIVSIQSLLYIGAAALAFRALEMFFLYKWPGAWLTGSMSDSVDRIALAVSTAYGAFYTGILASLYLPTAFILRLRARALSDESVVGTTEDREAWLAKSGLQFSPLQEFNRLLVILAPLIAGGSVAKVISFLGG
jgi:hypothetical protein